MSVLLKDVHLVDPVARRNGRFDVLIENDRIVRIDKNLPADGARIVELPASFIVTPAVIPEVIQACAERNVPVMPGAMTPTEVLMAWRLGATMVKIFPADQLGPAHLKALKAPFPHIPLMPTGGVTVETLPAFKKAGADAFGVGGSLFDPKQAAAENWDFFREQAARFVHAYTAS